MGIRGGVMDGVDIMDMVDGLTGSARTTVPTRE